MKYNIKIIRLIIKVSEIQFNLNRLNQYWYLLPLSENICISPGN